MKKIILVSFLSLASFSTMAASYGFKCKTDTGKNIEVAYSYNYDYSLEKVLIDGQNYLQSSAMSNTRGSGLKIYVNSFRNGDDLTLTIYGSNSSYQLGNGSERSMKCEDASPRKVPNDGL